MDYNTRIKLSPTGEDGLGDAVYQGSDKYGSIAMDDKLQLEDWILLKDGHRDSAVIRVEEIVRVVAVRNNMIVTARGEDITVRGSLVKLVERLPKQFISLGMSCVINMGHVSKVNALQRNLSFVMKDGSAHEVSRLRSRAIRKELSL
jgi:DNA-binding LytR/AlgR family response regulator